MPSRQGTGLVVHHDASLGLVLVDRNTVAIGPGDVTLSFGAPIRPRRAALCASCNPLHNFAVVSYDPADLNQLGALRLEMSTSFSPGSGLMLKMLRRCALSGHVHKL